MSEVEMNNDDEEISESEKTPVTIITGFLGSGKVSYDIKKCYLS